MATKTCFQPPCGHSATNPDSASASGARGKTALAALGTTRHSTDPVSPFRGFSAWTSNTPTPLCPTAPIPEGDPGDDGLGDDDNNNADNDDPSDDGPGDENPDENDPEDKLDFLDPDTEPAVAVFDNLTLAIKLLACSARTSPESSSRTKLHEPNTFYGTDPKKLHAFFIQCMALEWFEPDLLGFNDPNNQPLWMDSWREFILDNNKSGSSGNNNQPKTGQDKSKTGNNNNSSSSPKPASLKLGNNNNSNSSKPEPSKLRKDGKLTPEECKHCIEGNLCMFCRGPGHFTEKCPKKSGKAKAHAMATTEAALASGLGTTPKTKK
ncbi:hypothetical protein M404DRAFT_20315 [Pisolithus tinctorius Marx 270]|uniref:CCHC-type domain-containing protein n=1 Tax=Pisolithus tinctorius Marx 270 TaxID=870435 RepID=A0A0C3PSQ8_PISTI|nr:hypothetical protein M404DRAFT_20315 [Pisolithus tinctorius Marx 270]